MGNRNSRLSSFEAVDSVSVIPSNQPTDQPLDHFAAELPDRPPKASRFSFGKKSTPLVRKRTPGVLSSQPVLLSPQSSSSSPYMTECGSSSLPHPIFTNYTPGSTTPRKPFHLDGLSPPRKPVGSAAALSTSNNQRSSAAPSSHSQPEVLLLPGGESPLSKGPTSFRFDTLAPPQPLIDFAGTCPKYDRASSSKQSLEGPQNLPRAVSPRINGGNPQGATAPRDPLVERFSRLRQAHFGGSPSYPDIPTFNPNLHGTERATCIVESSVKHFTMGKARTSSHGPMPEASRPYPDVLQRNSHRQLRRERNENRSASPNGEFIYPNLSDALNHVPTSGPQAHPLGRGLAARQEALDRELAVQLQEEEDRAYANRLQVYGSSNSIDTPFASLSHFRRGTREAPIELFDSDSDSDSGFVLALPWQRQQDGVHPLSSPPSYDRIRQQDEDAEMARRLQHEETAVQTRDCAVCGVEVSVRELPTVANCAHQPETCSDCFAGWIASELENKKWDNIKCPGSDCRVILQHHEVQQYASSEVYARFDELSARSALNNEPNFRWCRRPGCPSGQIHGEEGNIFACVACGHKVCVKHDDTFHEGETCEEFDYRKSGRMKRDQQLQEEASVRAISKLTQKCPGDGCGWNIEKKDGCDHMTCSQCRHQFCFECLAPYEPIRRKGNSAHRNGCKYHTSRVRD